MKATKICNYSDFANHPNLRLGDHYDIPEFQYPMKPFKLFVSSCEAGSRPRGGIDSKDYGQALSLGGEQIGNNGLLNTEKLPYVSYEYYSSNCKGRVRNEDILLCKDGALTGKVCIVDTDALPTSSVMVNEHVYVVRGNEKINQRFLYYLMRTPLFREQVSDLAFRKKGQPGLNSDHLKEILLPEVPLDEQNRILGNLAPLNERSAQLQRAIIPIGNLIDSVLFSSFSIDKSAFDSIEKDNPLNINIIDIENNNTNIRFSYRWIKAVALQEHLKTNIRCCKKLGNYIIDTQNGWSPTCNNWKGTYQVLGVDAIARDGVMRFNNVKYSSEPNERIAQYYVKDGDFYVSRGNTTDLVAMAAIAHVKEDTPLTVFPDLMIRVRFNEKIVNEYVALVFNSSMGRYYFKYSAKGKNQTMVKVSKQELCDFFIPIPAIEMQERIVEAVHGELEKQRAIKNQLALLDAEKATLFMRLLQEHDI